VQASAASPSAVHGLHAFGLHYTVLFCTKEYCTEEYRTPLSWADSPSAVHGLHALAPVLAILEAHSDHALGVVGVHLGAPAANTSFRC